MNGAPETCSVACSVCGAGSQYPSDTSTVVCKVCGGTASFRRCPGCNDLVYFGPAHHGKTVKWTHPQCRKSARPEHWPEAGVGEFYLGDPSLDAFYERMGAILRFCTRIEIGDSVKDRFVRRLGSPEW
jgi:hypothetical protein